MPSSNASIQAAYTKYLRRLNQAIQYTQQPALLARRINVALARDHGDLVRGIIKDRFTTGGGTSGNNWAPLAASTQKQRAQQGFGAAAPILVRSGALARAASDGQLVATADNITLMFKDGPAPRYVGKGRARPQTMNAARKAARNQAIMEGASSLPSAGRLSDYAGALNDRRSFYCKPQPQELTELLMERNLLIARAITAIANGQSLSTIL